MRQTRIVIKMTQTILSRLLLWTLTKRLIAVSTRSDDVIPAQCWSARHQWRHPAPAQARHDSQPPALPRSSSLHHRPTIDPPPHYHELIAALTDTLLRHWNLKHRSHARSPNAIGNESDFTTNFVSVSREPLRLRYLEQIARLMIRNLARLALEFWRRYTT